MGLRLKQNLWHGCFRTVRLKTLFSELGVCVDKPIPVYEDNQSYISALHSGDLKRFKHIDSKYNFVKDLCENEIISVKYLPTGEQRADIMTKGLPYESFSKHRESIGMCKCPSK